MTLPDLCQIISTLRKHLGLESSGPAEPPRLPFPIPRGLAECYSAFGPSWERGGRRLFGRQDHLLAITELELTGETWRDQPCSPGRVLFAAENQAVWIATTLPEGRDDCPVEFYYDGQPVRILSSMNRFLAALMLRETLMGTPHGGSSPTQISDPTWEDRGFSHLMTDGDRVAGWHYSDYYATPDGAILLATDDAGEVAALGSRRPLPPWPDIA